jgi:hypothetical protein
MYNQWRSDLGFLPQKSRLSAQSPSVWPPPLTKSPTEHWTSGSRSSPYPNASLRHRLESPTRYEPCGFNLLSYTIILIFPIIVSTTIIGAKDAMVKVQLMPTKECPRYVPPQIQADSPYGSSGVKCIYSPWSCRLCPEQSSNSEFALVQSSNLLWISIYGPIYELTAVYYWRGNKPGLQHNGVPG